MAEAEAPAPAPEFCTICQEDIHDPDVVGVSRGIILPCHHPYHGHCLYELAADFMWVGRPTRCPVCRGAVEGVRMELPNPFASWRRPEGHRLRDDNNAVGPG
jgi:hypothetical protein